MPTRMEAVRVLYQLINSGILSDDLETDLQNIANCIEAEEKKEIFLWGAKDDDWLELYIGRREDLINDAWLHYIDAIQQKYAIYKRGQRKF